MSYACFTVPHCCKGPNGSYYLYVDIINQQFSYYYFAKHMTLQEIFCTQTLGQSGFYWCKNLNCFGEKWGVMKLWITKWTFKSKLTGCVECIVFSCSRKWLIRGEAKKVCRLTKKELCYNSELCILIEFLHLF